MDIQTLDDLKQFVDEKVEDIIANTDSVPAKKLGLDNRCGTFYVDKEREWVAIAHHNLRLVRYYGGFEYIDEEHVSAMGGYIFYSVEAERVQDAIDTLDGAGEDAVEGAEQDEE